MIIKIFYFGNVKGFKNKLKFSLIIELKLIYFGE